VVARLVSKLGSVRAALDSNYWFFCHLTVSYPISHAGTQHCGRTGGIILLDTTVPPLAHLPWDGRGSIAGVAWLAIGILHHQMADGQSGRTQSGEDKCVHSLSQRR